MNTRHRAWMGLSILGAGLLWAAVALAQDRQSPAPTRPQPTRFVPNFEVLAETRLLMEGLTQPNFRSLTRTLKRKPADQETWTFARGQALLIGETGNLLLLRPPHNKGQDTWMRQAMDMRQAAGVLSRHLADRDLERSRADLATLAHTCNHCHQTFRVKARIGPEIAEDKP